MPAASPIVADRSEAAFADGTTLSSIERLRLFALSLAITLAVFAQNAGSVAADTKLDLIVDPARFLGRSLSLWDPTGSAGQLQDQAYGYLFPMGPFFLVGHWLALPPWIVQRSWESAVLVAAFVGMVRLARALRVTGFWPPVAAGLVYALAPRMLSELFTISSELLPVAVLPWVLLPLTRRRLDPRRAAAWSGVALLFAGGINASATLAILPVPALYLLTRRRGPARAALIRWWLLSVVLACLWWAIPLLTLGRYSPPFLNWIESSAVTTTPTSLAATLRGVDQWLAYLGPTSWPAGWVLVVAPAAILATGLVAAAGLAGLVRSGRDRAFLVSTLLLGLVLLTLGHRTGIGPPFALTWQHLLDGPANAFRNVHKFDPLVRLPIAIGVGRLLAWSSRQPVQIPFPVQWKPGQLVALVAIAVGVVAIGPVFGGGMVSQPRPSAEASWWPQAASWLDDHAGTGRALVVPGGRPDLIWGQTSDDPLQPLAKTPWSVRDALPLAQPGYIRYLDSIDAILARGVGDGTLTPLLERAGVEYLVVRNDLDAAAAQAARLAFVQSTILNSPGLKLVAGFGPNFGGSTGPYDLTDRGAWPPSAAVQIYAVGTYSGPVVLQPVAGQLSGIGSGDALPALVERGMGRNQAVVFGAGGGTSVATDGIRRREVVFGAVDGNAATLFADAPFQLPRAAHDYLPGNAGTLSAYRLIGARAIRASSSGAQVNAVLNSGPANGPYSAVDGDATTAWKSGVNGAVGQWIEVGLNSPINPKKLQIAFADGLGDYPSRVRVTTDAGFLDSDVASDANVQPVQVPDGPTQSIRLTVLEMAAHGSSVGLRTLSIPGVRISRTLDVHTPGTPDVLAFDVSAGHRSECLPVRDGVACDPAFVAAGEEDDALDRSFTLSRDRVYHVGATIRLKPSALLDERLDKLSSLTATASSSQSTDPRVRPGAAVDGDPETAWIAGPGDATPTLTVRLPAVQRLDGVRLSTSADLPASRPTRVQIQVGTYSWTGPVPTDGRIGFGQFVSTGLIKISVLAVSNRTSVDGLSGFPSVLPPGLSEVSPLGVSEPVPSGSNVSIGCSDGLSLQVDARSMPMRAVAGVAAALAGQPVLAVPCGDDLVHFAAGQHRIRLTQTSFAAPESMTATAQNASLLGNPSTSGFVASAEKWGSTSRRVRVTAPAAAYLVIHENANAGWQATVNGHRLADVLIDGWEQGFLVPAGTNGIVRLTFVPQRSYIGGLLAGLTAALLLITFALRPTKRIRHAPAAGRVHPLVHTTAVLAAGFALLGFAGLATAAAALVVARRLAWWFSSVLIAVATALIALFPPASAHSLTDSPFIQLLCGAAVLFVAAAGVDPTRWARSISRRSNPNQESPATTVAETAVSR